MSDIGILEQIELMIKALKESDTFYDKVSIELDKELWLVILKAAENYFKNIE